MPGKLILREGLRWRIKKPRAKKQDERNEPFEKFQDIVKKLMSVPKEEVHEKWGRDGNMKIGRNGLVRPSQISSPIER